MKCICGCDEFYIQYFGDLSKHFIDHYVLKTVLCDNEYVICMKAVCAKCKREYIVFNSLTNDYDWNCQEMCSRGIPKIMDRQESGGVMRELL